MGAQRDGQGFFGWRVVAVVCVLADRVFARAPEGMGQAPDGDAPDAPVRA